MNVYEVRVQHVVTDRLIIGAEDETKLEAGMKDFLQSLTNPQVLSSKLLGVEGEVDLEEILSEDTVTQPLN